MPLDIAIHSADTQHRLTQIGVFLALRIVEPAPGAGSDEVGNREMQLLWEEHQASFNRLLNELDSFNHCIKNLYQEYLSAYDSEKRAIDNYRGENWYDTERAIQEKKRERHAKNLATLKWRKTYLENRFHHVLNEIYQSLTNPDHQLKKDSDAKFYASKKEFLISLLGLPFGIGLVTWSGGGPLIIVNLIMIVLGFALNPFFFLATAITFGAGFLIGVGMGIYFLTQLHRDGGGLFCHEDVFFFDLIRFAFSKLAEVVEVVNDNQAALAPTIAQLRQSQALFEEAPRENSSLQAMGQLGDAATVQDPSPSEAVSYAGPIAPVVGIPMGYAPPNP